MQSAPNLLQEGFNLMLLGMGFVFTFLAVLVLATTLMSRLIQRFLPEPTRPASSATTPASTITQNTPVIAAITAALHLHRQKQQNNK